MKERQEQKMIALEKARDIVHEIRADALTSLSKQRELREQRSKDASAIRMEANKNRKHILKQEKKYLRRA